MLERGIRDGDEEALRVALEKSALIRKHFGDAVVDAGIAAMKCVRAFNESAAPPLRAALSGPQSCPFTEAHAMRIHQSGQDPAAVASVCRDLVPGLAVLDKASAEAAGHFSGAALRRLPKSFALRALYAASGRLEVPSSTATGMRWASISHSPLRCLTIKASHRPLKAVTPGRIVTARRQACARRQASVLPFLLERMQQRVARYPERLRCRSAHTEAPSRRASWSNAPLAEH